MQWHFEIIRIPEDIFVANEGYFENHRHVEEHMRSISEFSILFYFILNFTISSTYSSDTRITVKPLVQWTNQQHRLTLMKDQLPFS